MMSLGMASGCFTAQSSKHLLAMISLHSVTISGLDLVMCSDVSGSTAVGTKVSFIYSAILIPKR